MELFIDPTALTARFLGFFGVGVNIKALLPGTLW